MLLYAAHYHNWPVETLCGPVSLEVSGEKLLILPSRLLGSTGCGACPFHHI